MYKREPIAMVREADNAGKTIRVRVEAGICGFTGVIEARKLDGRNVSLEITEFDCDKIQGLAGRLKAMTMVELFTPITKNPAYVLAEKSGCHSPCPVPSAVLKAVEAAMEMAIPREVGIRFET
ncbi:MAG: hypothetical protein GY866_32545 [Proteobacteria bacterium]|nr:hypothetical protein [Pseudomonadota bacterium]